MAANILQLVNEPRNCFDNVDAVCRRQRSLPHQVPKPGSITINIPNHLFKKKTREQMQPWLNPTHLSGSISDNPALQHHCTEASTRFWSGTGDNFLTERYER